MRLMRRDLATVDVYRKTTAPSDYIGTISKLTKIATIQGIVSPATDKATAEIYGKDAEHMITITLHSGSDIKAHDVVQIDGAYFDILSVQHYSDHDVVSAGGAEHGNQD